jgi:integrase
VSIKKAMRRTAERAGLEDVGAHTLRHTAAVWMAEAARPMEEISEYLGHTNLNLTKRVYARYSPSYLQKAAAALERPLA